MSPDKVHAFMQDMWNPGYGQGLYFSALHELGEDMYVPIKVNDKWVYALHAIFDGLSLLDDLNRSNPELGLRYSMKTPHSPPHGLSWLSALKTALTSKPIEAHSFKRQLPYDKKFNHEVMTFHLEFTPEETRLLETFNLTSFLLEKVGKIFMRDLSLNQTTRWMIPVNIRGPFSPAPLSQMEASYIGVNCSMTDTSATIKKQLVGKLKAGEQWGFWLLGKIGLMMGRSFIVKQTIKSLNEKKSQWFAFFSNLGNIGGNISSPPLLIMPTVRWHRPIGCVSYVYRNQLNLTVSFHPSLALNESSLENYKNEIRQSILSA